MGKKRPPRPFPADAVRPVAAAFGGSLVFNPFAEIPPSLWYGLEIELDQIELDSGPLDADIVLGGLVLPARDWRALSGAYGPMPDVGVSSVEVGGIQHSIDVRRVELQRLEDTLFRVTVDVTINFEAEATGYLDAALSLAVEAEHQGLYFHEPQWEDPSAVRIPAAWDIPERFTEASVRALFERFVDTSQYDLARDGPAYHLCPRL